MNEPRPEERQEEMSQQKMEQMRQKAAEIQEKVIKSIDQAMSSTAENLEKTANSLHKSAEFFRNKNADSIKEDVSNLVKKYPGQTVLGAIFFGFLFGRIISR